MRKLYKVQKKDGSLEDFDRGKITGGVMKAGGSAEDAEKVAADINAWLSTVAENGIVKSMDIRTKGLESLRQVNPTAASNFESYKKSDGCDCGCGSDCPTC